MDTLIHTTPSRPGGAPETRSAELFTVEGGTDLLFTVSWHRRSNGPKRLLTAPLVLVLVRPLSRLLAHSHATQISLHFRNQL